MSSSVKHFTLLPLAALTLSAMASSAFALPTPGNGGGSHSAPSFHPSAPAYHPSAPAYHPSAPAYHPSAPAYHPSAPAYHPSAPVHYAPAPVSHAPAPVTHAPSAPINHAPAPIAHNPSAPAPISHAPGNYGPGTSAPISHGSVSNNGYRPFTPVPVSHPVMSNRPITGYHGGTRYTQNAVVVNNVHMVSRSYNFGSTVVVRNYRPFGWGGNYIYAYHYGTRPYSPAFYGWAYNPWYSPVSYNWGWYHSRAEWYGCYGYYYRPYAYYRAPAYWVTDWLIADMLENEYLERSYENRQIALANARAEEANARAVAISEEMKEQIKLQVEAAMRAQQAQEATPVSTSLNDLSHIYAVSEAKNFTSVSTNQICMLSAGDLIKQRDEVTEGSQVVNMTVISSKAGSCDAGSVVAISVTDLQEYENDFNQRVESGMEKMKTEFHQN